MKKITMAIAVALIAGGCADQGRRLARGDEPSPSPSVTVHHATAAPNFMIEGAEYASVSALVSPLAAKLAGRFEGRSLSDRLALQDPVAIVRERLIGALRPTLSDAVTLEVRTTAWGLQDDQVRYQARARLVRFDRSDVLWEATCALPGAAPDAPRASREALTANEGELVKMKLAQAALACADQLAALPREVL